MGTELAHGSERAHAFFEAVRRDPEKLKFDPGFIDHDPGPGQPSGGQGLARFSRKFENAFSDATRTEAQTIVTQTDELGLMSQLGLVAGPER
ncbi:hypothetical protein [uncultured Jatrophihabitans sp.]|uniref:hypothetical protein n=1 Tax=uncultured Jatrophihabitans sp. TaxID=1610747 RepID=UPI0035CAC952